MKNYNIHIYHILHINNYHELPSKKMILIPAHRPSDASAWARRTAERRPCGALGPRIGLESADALPPNPAWHKMINNLVAKRITKLADLLCYIYIYITISPFFSIVGMRIN